jgi:hypothetical protein
MAIPAPAARRIGLAITALSRSLARVSIACSETVLRRRGRVDR